MRDIMLNYHKYIALPACLALLFGMPLAVPAADDSTNMNREAHEQSNDTNRKNVQSDANTELDQGTKQKFVNAYVEIKDIQTKYSKKLENVSDEGKAQELQKQAQSEMVKIVKSNDMTVQEYNEIVNAISSDPELRMEIEKMAQAQTE